jgi:hypothetical protein
MDMKRSARIALVVVAGLLAALILAPPASASWASEDGDFEVAQFDVPGDVCHDGMVFDYAIHQVLYAGYADLYNAATEVAKEKADDAANYSAGHLIALDYTTRQQVGLGSSFVPWNPTRTLPLENTGDDSLRPDGIHLLEGRVAIQFRVLRATGTSIELTHPNSNEDIHFVETPVTDCFRYANVTLGSRTRTTVQVILHGNQYLATDGLTPAQFRIKFAGSLFLSSAQPLSHSVQKVDSDSYPDLVLTYHASSSQTPVMLSGQTAKNGLLQGTVH